MNRSFTVGDRVAEKPKPHASAVSSQAARDRVAKYRAQRYGTVVDVIEKKTKSNRSFKYLLIRWDHLKTPTEHAQQRICHLEDFEQVVKNSMYSF